MGIEDKPGRLDPEVEKREGQEVEAEVGAESEADREARIDEETWQEARRQNREFLAAKAETFSRVVDENDELLTSLLEVASREEFTSGQQVDQFLAHPPSGKGIEDPDLRSIMTKALGKVQPIVEMPQAQERLRALVKGEQTQIWLAEQSASMDWYKSPDGQETLAKIRRDIENGQFKQSGT